MKKTFCTSLLILLLLSITSSSLAAETTYYSDYEEFKQSDEYNSIINLDDATIAYFKEILAQESIVLTEQLDDLDYTRILKIYVDTGIESINSADKTTILEVLETSNYVWVIPVEVNEHHFQITYARVGSSSNNEWKVTEIALRTILPYDITLKNVYGIEKFSDVVLIGGIPSFHMPVALTFSNARAVSWIDLGYSESYFQELLGTTKTRNTTNIYDFSEVLAAMKESTTGTTGIGGAGSIYSNILLTKLLLLALTLSCLFAIFLVVRHIKNSRSKE